MQQENQNKSKRRKVARPKVDPKPTDLITGTFKFNVSFVINVIAMLSLILIALMLYPNGYVNINTVIGAAAATLGYFGVYLIRAIGFERRKAAGLLFLQMALDLAFIATSLRIIFALPN